MAAITAELALEISKFQASLKQAQDHLRSFKAKTENTGRGLGSSLTSGLSEAVGGIGPMLVTGITTAFVDIVRPEVRHQRNAVVIIIGVTVEQKYLISRTQIG